MVANRRYATINAPQVAPYLLHAAMVVGVAAYVLIGAWTIRSIEATKSAKGFYVKGQRHQDAIQWRSQRGAPPAVEPEKLGWDVKYDPYLKRRCVTDVLKNSTIAKQCAFDAMHDDLYEALNHCFDDTLRHRFQRAVEKELGVIGTFEDASSSTTEEPPTELEDWEYWSMKDSVLFCFTVITTIGYGNVAPQTTRGRLFVIFYGLIGVPLTMLVIANLGKFLAQMLKNFMKGVRKVLRKLWRSLRRLCIYRSKEKRLLSPSDSERTELPTLRTMEATESEVSSEDGEENVHQNAAELFIAFVIYIALGSLAISLYEPEMDYFKAIYFNFVTLTTIGLGDIIPESERYLPFTLIYCAIGLALTTSAIEIAADYLKRLHYFGRKLDHVENVSIWFGAKKKLWRSLRRLCIYRSKEKRLLSPSDSERTELPTLRTMEATESEVSSEDGEENVHQNAAELFIAFVIYIALGSLAISLYEPEMDYFKAIYFNFVTLTTIGLGDIIPESERYLPFTLIYCAIGLALTTSAIEIAADYLKRLHYFGRKLDHVENVSIWFGAKKLTMKQLVKNLGDQFNLPEAEIENLNIDQFVDAAIKVESGEIETLRQPLLGKPISAADFRNAGRVPWIDEDAYSNLSKSIDERLTLRGD